MNPQNKYFRFLFISYAKTRTPNPLSAGREGGLSPYQILRRGRGLTISQYFERRSRERVPCNPHLKRVPCNPPSKKSALQPPFKNSALQPPWKFGRGLMRNLLNGYIKLKIFANNYIVVWQSSKCTSGILWKWILCTCFLASFDDHLLVPCFLMI